MINPNRIIVWYSRRTDRARGTKCYHAGLDLPPTYTRISRRKFRTATEAVEYGERAKARWIRLYTAMSLPESEQA
jgi:hypothetical protein